MKSLHATVFSPTPLPLFPLILGPGTKFAALKTHNLPTSGSPTQEFPQNAGDLLWSRVLVVRKGWAWKIFPFTWLFILGVAKFCKKISLNFCALLDYQWTLKISFNPDPNNLLNSQRLLIRFNFAGIALLNIILIFSFQEEPLSPLPYKRTPPSKSGTYLDDHLPSGPKHSAARMNFHQWISIPSFSPWPQQLQAVAKKLYVHNVISNLIHFWKVVCLVAWRLEGGII